MRPEAPSFARPRASRSRMTWPTGRTLQVAASLFSCCAPDASPDAQGEGRQNVASNWRARCVGSMMCSQQVHSPAPAVHIVPQTASPPERQRPKYFAPRDSTGIIDAWQADLLARFCKEFVTAPSATAHPPSSAPPQHVWLPPTRRVCPSSITFTGRAITHRTAATCTLLLCQARFPTFALSDDVHSSAWLEDSM